MFDSLTIPEAKAIVWLKRFFRAVVIALLAIGVVSSYRAWVQIQRFEVSAPRILSAGSNVTASVVSSGRTFADVKVQLIQGSHAETVFTIFVQGNEWGFFDPRSQYASKTETLTPDLLSQFQPGPARIRAVATGRPQWTRLPPPTIRELAVQIP